MQLSKIYFVKGKLKVAMPGKKNSAESLHLVSQPNREYLV